ncbi:helix-turn-helix domain-containing protein [Paenarthrobacter sp. CC6]|uniref:helix-turn-helix domain-containing protein n=1 Tax=Paenarthrobacter sp. CC6 TaxID=3029184 RepID=UPI00339CCD46
MRKASYRNIRVPNLSVRILRDVLIGAGMDHLSPFLAAKLDPAIAEFPGSVVTGEQELAFQLKFVELTDGRTDLWIKAGKGYSLAAFGIHGLALSTSPTLTHWLRVAVEMDITYTMAEASAILNNRGALVGHQLSYPEAPPELVPFSVYRDVTSIFRAMATMSGKDPFPFSSVHLPLGEVSQELANMITAPIMVGAPEVRLEWDEHLSRELLPFGDTFQHETYVRQAKEHLRQFRLEQDWGRSVVDAMKATAGIGLAVSDVASMLNTSVRTLQRRLEQSGMNFRQARDLARFELAIDLLTGTNVSIAEISRRLGYEEPASFTVAFKRWSGRSPSQYRASPLPHR